MIVIKRDVFDPNEKPILVIDSWQANPDGTVTAKMPAGDTRGAYAYQEPGQYGVFGFTDNPVGAYQSARLNGAMAVAYWAKAPVPPARPQDVPFVYSYAELP